MRSVFVDNNQIEAAYAAIDRLHERIGKSAPGYYIETYGCQMNEHDSEKIAGMLEKIGYVPAESKADADFILFNTCCIREHAELRTFGNVGFVKEIKASKPSLVTAVCGCMMQQKGVANKLSSRFPFVDLVFGTNELHIFPLLLERVLDGEKIVEIKDIDGDIAEGLPVKRQPGFSTFVNIMYGCNNFCSYCVVPYVRGRERSRRIDDIVAEVIDIVNTKGYSEVTLLGQNVNSYNDNGIRFPELLRRVNDIEGLKRLRFMTSHPKDLSPDLIDSMAECDKVCPHIHLPVQSGSNRILSLMNRKYTREHYFDLVDALRRRVKDIEITTDIIVGFPGEMEEDFQDTLDLVKRVRFSAAYTFAYSPRAGTKAAVMDYQIDEALKKDRLARLNAVLLDSVVGNNDKYIGRIGEILIEGLDKRGEPMLFGKLGNLKMVYVKGPEELIGSFANVRIVGVRFNSLLGEIIQ